MATIPVNLWQPAIVAICGPGNLLLILEWSTPCVCSLRSLKSEISSSNQGLIAGVQGLSVKVASSGVGRCDESLIFPRLIDSVFPEHCRFTRKLHFHENPKTVEFVFG